MFEKTTSKVILDNLISNDVENKSKQMGCFAIRLNGFAGVLGCELHKSYRFASEISDRNKKHFPMIKGLFHSDELPKYGITQEEVDLVNEKLGIDVKAGSQDAFIIIVNDAKIAKRSLKYIVEVISELMDGVPSEVRQVDPKGTLTKFSRPMPGSARMYPETDIREIELMPSYLKDLAGKLPELYDVKLSRLVKKFGLDEVKVVDVLSRFSEDEFADLLKVGGKANGVYSTLFDLPKEVKKREKVEIVDFDFDLVKNILVAVADDKLNKANLYKLYVGLFKSGLSSVDDFYGYLKKNSLIVQAVDLGEVESRIRSVVDANSGAPFGALMGMCMKEFNGSVDGKVISSVLKKLV